MATKQIFRSNADALLTQSSLVLVAKPVWEAWCSSSSYPVYQLLARRSSLADCCLQLHHEEKPFFHLTHGVSHPYRIPDRLQRLHNDLILFLQQSSDRIIGRQNNRQDYLLPFIPKEMDVHKGKVICCRGEDCPPWGACGLVAQG